ncbi:MFS transporter [Bosea psychrotolerans]|uniref:MFS transporter n=1 Tax=Bosea psychrotolerans TaxID=1871628 RepID=UPI0024819F6D|nr:MFS transporter [Bosea psychrotolerans]
MGTPCISDKRHQFPPAIIAHTVWLCFPLRLMEEMLLERGIAVSYETVRRRALKFGQDYARGLMARIAPEGRVGEFFGLFARSGKVTSFLGPTLVALATTIFDSQRAGPAVLIAFFLAGGALLAGVKIERAR